MVSEKILDLSTCFDSTYINSPDLPIVCSISIPNSNAFEDWPNFPNAATPAQGRVANGRGFTQDDCLSSGLGEAVELASSCVWGGEAVFSSSVAKLDVPFFHPDELLGFSQSQIICRSDWNSKSNGFDWRPEPISIDREIDWVFAKDPVDGTEIAVPADFVFIGRQNSGVPNAIAIADSNGCAAGQSVEKAKTNALLELIERDATARWWYGRINCQLIPIRILLPHHELYSAITSRQRVTRLFDITSDLNVPCVAAVSSNQDGSGVAVGFSAGFDLLRVVVMAVMELAQIELAILATRSVAPIPPDLAYWLAHVASDRAPISGFANYRPSLPNDGEPSLESLIDRCHAANCSVAFAELTRREFQLPVVKAISPELCHYKPRFGKARLRSAGLIETDYSENLQTYCRRPYLTI